MSFKKEGVISATLTFRMSLMPESYTAVHDAINGNMDRFMF